MIPTCVEISVKGKPVKVPSIPVGDRFIAITGTWVKSAAIWDEEWLPAGGSPSPASIIAALERAGLSADWFTFAQVFTDPKPRFAYPFVWDNIAAIPILSFEDWWERGVSHDLRRDVKRAEKRGVEVRSAEFNAAFLNGVKRIYDEAPVRQGRPFWHYGKSVDAIRTENSTFFERSEFVGAYYQDELIGFLKIVYVDDVARLLQILCLDAERDKRPANALIAKAVEIAHLKGYKYLTYGKYTYGNKKNSTVVQFKRRNGFEEILFPRYYIPLSVRGQLLIRSGLHLGLKRLIPERLTNLLLKARAEAFARFARPPYHAVN